MATLDLQNRSPRVERLPDERLRVTRDYVVLNFIPKKPADLLADVWLDWGTQDSAFPETRLIRQDVSGQDGPFRDPVKEPPHLIRIFEEIPPVDEIQVGNNEVIRLKDGRIGIKAQFLQFSSATATPGTVGVTTAPGVATARMLSEDAPNDGTLRRIERIYETPGMISQNTETKDNGALSIITIKQAFMMPDTPAGYTIIDVDVQEINGFPTYTVTFAKGTGQIDTTDDYGQSINQGATGITRRTIRFLTTPAVSSNPIPAQSGFTLITTGFAEQDGYRLWTGVYAKGVGLVQADLDIRYDGHLHIYKRISLDVVPDTPTAQIGGSVVLVSANDRTADGYSIFEYTWAEGIGVVSDEIATRQDGLREQTYISIGTRVAPPGVVIRDDVSEETGYPLYRVTSMQTADGGAFPSSATMSFERFVPFLYPGRAKAYHITAENGWKAYDVFRSPPVQADVQATISITYTTNPSIGSLFNYWDPREWATIEAQWIGLNNVPGYAIVALPGYRSFSDTPLTFIASIWAGGLAGTMLGNIVYGGTTAVVTVFGGPPNPDDQTYTLDEAVEPAFTATDGTKWFRKTVVTATIPAQEALPV